jgi:hypothetical protein
VKASHVTASAAGVLSLPIRASGKAKRKLAGKGKAILHLSLTLSPTGNTPATQTDKVKLKKRSG